eukprot:3779012-Alexandrium_andersonii.AAC.1
MRTSPSPWTSVSAPRARTSSRARAPVTRTGPGGPSAKKKARATAGAPMSRPRTSSTRRIRTAPGSGLRCWSERS